MRVALGSRLSALGLSLGPLLGGRTRSTRRRGELHQPAVILSVSEGSAFGRANRARRSFAVLRMTEAARSAALLALVLVLGACRKQPAEEQEHRARSNLDAVELERIHPGPGTPERPPRSPTSLAGENPYEGNVYALQEGYRLYRWMNCVNCHGQGGGSIGPALWDDTWIYGSSPANVAESIIRGRPNGMPAYGERIPEEQVWMLVAYVRSLKPGGGLKRAGSH